MTAHDYLIIVHLDEDGGFWTEVRELSGCGSQGETVDEAVEMTKDAIHGFLASMWNMARRLRKRAPWQSGVTVAA